MKSLRLSLGDQLSNCISSLRDIDPACALVLMPESVGQSTVRAMEVSS